MKSYNSKLMIQIMQFKLSKIKSKILLVKNKLIKLNKNMQIQWPNYNNILKI